LIVHELLLRALLDAVSAAAHQVVVFDHMSLVWLDVGQYFTEVLATVHAIDAFDIIK
jgi:hypothetical protein